MASRNLVISFQRSGLNWLRHCAEHFGGVRTPGHPHLVREGPALFDRTHDVTRKNLRSDFTRLYDDNGNEIYRRVALLLRHPYDCFVSHYFGRKHFSFRRGLENFRIFALNILAFDRLRTGEKAVFYFEDFVNKERGTFAFLRYFGIDRPSQAQDFPALIESSREWYRAQHGLIAERKRRLLKRKERAAIRTMLEHELGDRFSFYLGRYDMLEQTRAD